MTDFESWPVLDGEISTGDDPVLCHLCGRDLSIATIVEHLATEHDIDPESIAGASVINATEDDAA